MIRLLSAALAAAIVLVLPLSATARPHGGKAEYSRHHAATTAGTRHTVRATTRRHAAARHHRTERAGLRAHRRQVHTAVRGSRQVRASRPALRAARHVNAQRSGLSRNHAHRSYAHRSYAYAPAAIPGNPAVAGGWTTPAVQAAPLRAAPAAPRVGGLVAPLAHKAAEISAACGARVISAVRHTRVAGTGRMSLHASGQAVDMRGNPGCIYRMLSGWPGGYSTDYGRAGHVHISWGGREQGLRFAHGGGRTRHAHGLGRIHQGGRYASRYGSGRYGVERYRAGRFAAGRYAGRRG
jgi:hypothetical protein